MAEGRRPANPAIRRTGAEGSRHTEMYARTSKLDFYLLSQGTVGGLTVLTAYLVPEASTET
jgi:hypothetical protein